MRLSGGENRIRTIGFGIRNGAPFLEIGAITKSTKSGLETAAFVRGTGSSNPFPSSGESDANLLDIR